MFRKAASSYWSVLREMQEWRSIYIAPLAVAALVLVGFLIATMGRAMSTSNLAQRRAILEEPYAFAAGAHVRWPRRSHSSPCSPCLHALPRRRAAIRQHPVLEVITGFPSLPPVLSKAAIPLVVLPLLTFTITVVTQLIMLLISSAVVMGSGLSVATLWTQLSLPQTWGLLLYHLLAIHSLLVRYIFWLVLQVVSAWARRAPVLSAVPVPPRAARSALVRRSNVQHRMVHPRPEAVCWRGDCGGLSPGPVAIRWI